MSRPNHDYRTGSKDAYREFCKKYPEVEISYQQYQEILHRWNSLVIKYITETGHKIKFPLGLGTLCVNKYRRHNKMIDGKLKVRRSIDWQKTKEEGKYIYHLNLHTDGFNYFFLWESKNSKIKSSIIWKFELARVHSRELAKLLKQPHNPYKDLYREWLKYFK